MNYCKNYLGRIVNSFLKKVIPLSLVFFVINGMIVLIVNSDHMLLIRSGMVVK